MKLDVNGADSVTLTSLSTSVNTSIDLGGANTINLSDTDVTAFGLSITTGTGGTLTAAALTSPLDAMMMMKHLH